MNSSEKRYITEELAKIKGATHVRIGRAADMIWIALKGVDGKDYAIHLQTFFRFCDGNQILITDMDKYQPTPEYRDADLTDCGKIGSNLLDQWCERFNSEFSETVTVSSINVNDNGDFTMALDNGMNLEVLVDNTVDDECWRFFVWRSQEKHLVVTGKGIQPQEDR